MIPLIMLPSYPVIWYTFSSGEPLIGTSVYLLSKQLFNVCGYVDMLMHNELYTQDRENE